MKDIKTYFSSDFHLGRKNILKYDNRPFESIELMNETIISNLESLLKKGDNFYYLGDLSFEKDLSIIEDFLIRLKNTGANIFFIKGNHDYNHIIKLYKKYGTYLGDYAEIKIQNKKIILMHYALRVWNGSHHGSWCLYGHSNDSLETTEWGKSMDCGIVSSARILGSWIPFEFNDIKDILDKREIKKVDLHN